MNMDWIPVTERLPDQRSSDHRSDDVLLVAPELGRRPYIGFYSAVSAVYRNETGWHVPHVHGGINVTHWMPLPPNPTTTHTGDEG